MATLTSCVEAEGFGYYVQFGVGLFPPPQKVLNRMSEESTQCSLIVSEVGIEGMSCRSFLAEVRTMPDFDDAMIILLASDYVCEELEQCLELGIAGVIKQPFRNDAFPELLQEFYHRLKYLSGNYKALFLSTFATFYEAASRFKSPVDKSLLQYKVENLFDDAAIATALNAFRIKWPDS